MTEVGQVSAPKTEDARADVVQLHGKQHHHLLDWFTEWPPSFEDTDATDGGRRTANGLALRKAAKEEGKEIMR